MIKKKLFIKNLILIDKIKDIIEYFFIIIKIKRMSFGLETSKLIGKWELESESNFQEFLYELGHFFYLFIYTKKTNK